jgi:hypothetical protein
MTFIAYIYLLWAGITSDDTCRRDYPFSEKRFDPGPKRFRGVTTGLGSTACLRPWEIAAGCVRKDAPFRLPSPVSCAIVSLRSVHGR